MENGGELPDTEEQQASPISRVASEIGNLFGPASLADTREHRIQQLLQIRQIITNHNIGERLASSVSLDNKGLMQQLQMVPDIAQGLAPMVYDLVTINTGDPTQKNSDLNTRLGVYIGLVVLLECDRARLNCYPEQSRDMWRLKTSDWETTLNYFRKSVQPASGYPYLGYIDVPPNYISRAIEATGHNPTETTQ